MINQTALFRELKSHFLGVITLIFLIFPRYTTFAIIGWVLYVIIEGFKKKFTFRINRYLLLWIILYGLYLVGVLFTNHPSIAGKYLEYKLAFLIFPLLFFFQLPQKLKVQIIFRWGILGIILVLILSVLNSYKCGRETVCWISSTFSYIHHPTYLAQFLTFFFFGAIYGCTQNWKWFSLKGTIFLCLITLIGILLCFSFAGIITFFASLIVVLFYVISKKFSLTTAIISSLLFTIGSILFLKSAPQVKDDWFTVNRITNEYINSPSDFIQSRTYPLSGTEVRLVMWTAAVQTMKKYPFGVGTGNVDEKLSETLIKLHQNELAKENYNPHNQYLQIGVELGVIGMLFLFFMFGVLMWKSLKSKNYLLFFLIFTLFLNCFFESMLQRQSGIIFNCFWSCLLIVGSFSGNEKNRANTFL
jgi:O-antigen ligase